MIRTRPVVAIHGERGSFSDHAVTTYWNGAAASLPQLDCVRVARAVQGGQATHGLLAIENSIAGAIPEAHDTLADWNDLAVVGEVIIPISLALLGQPGSAIDRLRSVRSHRMALRQCTRFLRAHAYIASVEAYDTSGAARDVAARGDPAEGALAPRGCATRYGLDVLAEGIEDRADNQTRFWVVLRNPAGEADSSALTGTRAALLVDPSGDAALLPNILAGVVSSGGKVTRVDARPGRWRWCYRYIVDVELPPGPERGSRLAAVAAAYAPHVRVLGSFRAWSDGSENREPLTRGAAHAS